MTQCVDIKKKIKKMKIQTLFYSPTVIRKQDKTL